MTTPKIREINLRRRFTWKRFLIRMAGLAVLTLLTSLAVRVYYWKLADDAVAAAEAEADQNDPGWRWEELLAKRAVVPDEKNSGLKVLRAAGKLPKAWPEEPFDPRDDEQVQKHFRDKESTIVDRVEALEPSDPLADELAKELSKELTRLAPALAELDGLAELSEGCYAINFKRDAMVTLLPHIPKARTVANALGVSSK